MAGSGRPEVTSRANRSVGVNTLDDFAHGAWVLLKKEGYVVEVLKQLGKFEGEQDGANGFGQGYRGFNLAGHWVSPWCWFVVARSWHSCLLGYCGRISHSQYLLSIGRRRQVNALRGSETLARILTPRK